LIDKHYHLIYVSRVKKFQKVTCPDARTRRVSNELNLLYFTSWR